MTAVLPVAIAAWLLQDPEPDRILDRFRAARPSDDALAFYRLRWAPDLAAAKTLAAKEKRPICFLVITNISASDRFFTGHC
jgi:hypothetical protein